MARNENRCIPHGPQALDDAGNQCRVVTLRQIGSANRASKQHVTHKSAVRLGAVEHHMAGRVTWAVPHLQRALAQGHRVVVGQPARRREGHRLGKAEHLALCRQAVDPELICLLWADDGQMELRRQLTGTAGMIDVRMGKPDLAKRQSMLLHSSQQRVKITARVDECGLQRLVAPDERAVLLKIGDGNGLVA